MGFKQLPPPLFAMLQSATFTISRTARPVMQYKFASASSGLDWYIVAYATTRLPSYGYSTNETENLELENW
jgi:hypothetical protein